MHLAQEKLSTLKAITTRNTSFVEWAKETKAYGNLANLLQGFTHGKAHSLCFTQHIAIVVCSRLGRPQTTIFAILPCSYPCCGFPIFYRVQIFITYFYRCLSSLLALPLSFLAPLGKANVYQVPDRRTQGSNDFSSIV
jgi:hypothetical protein